MSRFITLDYSCLSSKAAQPQGLQIDGRLFPFDDFTDQLPRYQTVGHAEHVMAGGQYQIVKRIISLDDRQGVRRVWPKPAPYLNKFQIIDTGQNHVDRSAGRRDSSAIDG